MTNIKSIVLENEEKIELLGITDDFFFLQESPLSGKKVESIKLTFSGGKYLKLDLRALEENDIKTDSNTRDFTINAIYYDVFEDKFIDLVNGIQDIDAKIIKTIVSPEKTFHNSPSRLFRLLKASSKYDFSISQNILDYI